MFRLNGKGSLAPSETQYTNNPCLHPSDKSQSVDVSAIIIRTMTMKPQMKAMTFSGLVMVIVSMVVVGAIAEGDGCRMLNEIMRGEHELDRISRRSLAQLATYVGYKNWEM